MKRFMHSQWLSLLKRTTVIQTEIFFWIDCHVFMEISSDEAYFICPHCSWTRKKTFPKETPEIKNYYLPKIYNKLTSGLTLDWVQYELAKTMFNALVQFIHLQIEFKPPKRLNCKGFLSKILEHLFKIPAKILISQKDQEIWNSFLKYQNINLNSSEGSRP